ncbi:inositol monophosphatase [Candidatus Woesearchaeota archaeon]|nr:inositol monophosphatase [Candidatus Woesearchaeota archaeon]
MSAYLDVAVSAAKKAGKVLMGYYGDRGGRKTMKGASDFLTEADSAAEDIIKSFIGKRFPSHSILAEESGMEEKGSGFRWVVDPLDGTHNFAWNIPVWCTGIALERSGEVVVAAVFAPVLGQLFWAEKGRGAFLNGRRIHVSGRKFPFCMVEVDAFSAERVKLPVERFVAVGSRFSRLRILGSSVYSSCSVAAGNLDAYAGLGQKPWDSAPGVLLVREAGGLVRSIDGSGASHYSGNIVYSNRKVFREFMSALSPST